MLLGGLRALGANTGQSRHGVLTRRPETLTNAFFVNLLDMRTAWLATSEEEAEFEGRDRAKGEVKWTGTRADLIFGSNAQLSAVSKIFAQSGAQGSLVNAFVTA